ncbi:LysR family transcriptional regulator [Sphingomonas sp. JC676]|uniref:LysR family transcriptional regulator n=1 Tax=Sphingomonas sp. JC676 TaxID=2768065 RepID=UPI00165802C4|nr:LysR family transcriptional regulator [Sphingomonas sp. JC676]MBC9034449.1 LysR family transcriptional regulator [Sphingomonas sp. JC676]
MLELNDLLTFTKIVEMENLTKAGRALGVPKSTVSRRMTRLEEHLGTQLVRRSTHQVVLTDQGALFYEYCQRCLGLLRDGERAIQNQHLNPQGLLRIVVPHELDRSVLGPLMRDYLETYPDVRLVSVVASEQVALLRDGFDVAIVAGELPDAGSSFLATKLGEAEYGIYTAPSYVERKGMPQSHVDLARFDLLAWGETDMRGLWRLRSEAGEVAVEFKPRLVCNDLMLLRQSVLSGLGIAALPAFICKHDLASGRILEVLPGWHAPPTQFYAVFPHQHGIPPHVRALINYLVERLRPTFSWDVRPSAGMHDPVSGETRVAGREPEFT